MSDALSADFLTALEWVLDYVERQPCDADGACAGMSVTRRMCSRCRIRLSLSHAIRERPNPITGGRRFEKAGAA